MIDLEMEGLESGRVLLTCHLGCESMASRSNEKMKRAVSERAKI